MRITQLDCRTLDDFARIIFPKWGMYQYLNKNAPVVFFGCYSVMAKTAIMNHKGLVVIVWAGGDSLRLVERQDFVEYCQRNEHRVFHFAHSWWIQRDLEFYGLKYIDKVILPQNLEQFKFEPKKGRSIYHYTAPDKNRQWYYGTDIVSKLRDRWVNVKGYPDNVYITNFTALKGQELIDAYADSSVGVRLTEHDNMALSCIEMGLMGRRSIFNGNIPCAIPYPTKGEYVPDKRMQREPMFRVDDLEGVIGKMILEHWHDEPDRLLAEEMREFVYDDEEWLDTKYYE